MSEEHVEDQELPSYLSTGQAARILNVSPEAVWQMVKGGRLPGMRVARNWIISRDALLEFAKTYQKGPGRRRHKPQERRQQ